MSDYFEAEMLRKVQALEKGGVVLNTAKKILLAEVGAVEYVLASLTGAPIHVYVISQSEEKDIIRRKVVLISDSGRTLLRASSKIYCTNLPRTVIEKIKSRKSGIGTIISTSQLEVSRKITKIGVKNGVPYRAYKIFHRKKIAFEIKEDILLKGGPGGI